MATLADRIYRRLPVPLQHAAVTAFGLKWRWKRFGLGPAFEREVQGYLDRERFSSEEWRAWQTRTLREVLRLAARAPHYQPLKLDDRKIDRFTLDDVRHLPILEKNDTRANPDAFLVGGHPPRGATICPTSGSTGTPVRTYWTSDDFRRSLALREARAARPAGVSFRDPRCTFSGRIVVPDPRSAGPFHRFNAVERQVYFSAFHLAPQHARAYLEPLVRHGTVWGTGYTHSFEQLGRMMIEQGLPPPPALRAIVTTSEKMTPEGREAIERAFRCAVREEYGQVEDACWACDRGDARLVVSPDAGLLELVDRNGNPLAADDDGEGEVVATSFVRRSQIFLRYRLGDVARRAPGPGAMPTLKEIVGRLEDVIVGPDGRRTVRFHGIFVEVPGVREAQVVQERIDRIRVKVVASPAYGDDTVREIKKRIQQRFTDAMAVEVERVEAIPRTAAGKYRAVVSLL
jgi:phenylacetate-CoA ligase